MSETATEQEQKEPAEALTEDFEFVMPESGKQIPDVSIIPEGKQPCEVVGVYPGKTGEKSKFPGQIYAQVKLKSLTYPGAALAKFLLMYPDERMIGVPSTKDPDVDMYTNAVTRFRKEVKAFGGDPNKFRLSDIKGALVEATIEHEDYQGEPQANARFVDKYKGEKKAGPKPAVGASSTLPHDEFDDIPF